MLCLITSHWILSWPEHWASLKKQGSEHARTRVTVLTLPGKGIKFCHLCCTELEQDLSVLVWRCYCEHLCDHFAIWSGPGQLQWPLKSRCCFLASSWIGELTSTRATCKLPRAAGCCYMTLHLVSSLACFLDQLEKREGSCFRQDRG